MNSERATVRTVLLLMLLMTAAVALGSCSGGGDNAGVAPTAATARPDAPTSVAAIAGSAAVTVLWSAMPNATSYSVFRSGGATTNYAVQASGLSSTVYTDTTVTAGNTYSYVVASAGRAGESGMSEPALATPHAASPGRETLSGTVQYEDKRYDRTGFTGDRPLKAVRHARVDLVDFVSKATITTMVTSPAGTFSFDLSAIAGRKVYVSVEADAVAPAGEVLVRNMQRKLYAAGSAGLAVPSGSVAYLSLRVPAGTVGGAFNIMDVYTSGAEFVSSLAASSVPKLNVYWPNSVSGTYYCTASSGCVNGEGIYVLSDPPSPQDGAYDTDEYDDDVLWHEYGHFVADRFSRDDSPGGAHAFTVNDYDLRLSWSEGWGDFFETAVKAWLNDTNPALLSVDPSTTPLSQYVDTATKPGWFYISLDLAHPEAGPCPTDVCIGDQCKYASNEVAVASVLWTIMEGNGTNGGYGMLPIWAAITDASFTATTPRVNVESFFDTIVSRNASSTADIQSVLALRSIDYAADGFETDDVPLSAKTYTAIPQYHTLHPENDEDLVLFSSSGAAAVTITASNLRNGADTYLTLYQSDCATMVVPPNDNTSGITYLSCLDDPGPGCNYDYYSSTTGAYVYPLNNATNLASTIKIPLPAGSYCVSVRSSPQRPKSAGRYGSFTLTITQ